MAVKYSFVTKLQLKVPLRQVWDAIDNSLGMAAVVERGSICH
jgi:hypothetical protein